MGVREACKVLFICFLRLFATPLTQLHRSLDDVSTRQKTAVLCYHKITRLQQGLDGFWSITPEMFQEHMAFLAKNQFVVLTIEQLLESYRRSIPLPEKSVLITFDDGYIGHFRYALPILKSYRFPAILFLATNYVGENRFFPWDREQIRQRPEYRDESRLLRWEEILEMQASGLIHFGSHSVSHRHLGTLPERAIRHELSTSKAILEAKLGQPIRCFAYPGGIEVYGDLNATTRRLLAETGYKLAFTSTLGRISSDDDPFHLKRVGISRFDSEPLFGAKLSGACDWMIHAQRGFQQCFSNFW